MLALILMEKVLIEHRIRFSEIIYHPLYDRLILRAKNIRGILDSPLYKALEGIETNE
jgi:hypothetical protein